MGGRKHSGVEAARCEDVAHWRLELHCLRPPVVEVLTVVAALHDRRTEFTDIHVHSLIAVLDRDPVGSRHGESLPDRIARLARRAIVRSMTAALDGLIEVATLSIETLDLESLHPQVLLAAVRHEAEVEWPEGSTWPKPRLEYRPVELRSCVFGPAEAAATARFLSESRAESIAALDLEARSRLGVTFHLAGRGAKKTIDLPAIEFVSAPGAPIANTAAGEPAGWRTELEKRLRALRDRRRASLAMFRTAWNWNMRRMQTSADRCPPEATGSHVDDAGASLIERIDRLAIDSICCRRRHAIADDAASDVLMDLLVRPLRVKDPRRFDSFVARMIRRAIARRLEEVEFVPLEPIEQNLEEGSARRELLASHAALEEAVTLARRGLRSGERTLLRDAVALALGRITRAEFRRLCKADGPRLNQRVSRLRTRIRGVASELGRDPRRKEVAALVTCLAELLDRRRRSTSRELVSTSS